MTTPAQTDEAIRLAERTRKISAETQIAIKEANLAIKRTHEVIERARQESKDDPDLAHVIRKVIT